MKILVISNNYPSNESPSSGVFVYRLIQQFATLGHEVTLISPSGISPKSLFNKTKNKNSRLKSGYGKELAKVYRPKFFSASAKFIFGFNTYRIGEKFQMYAVKRVVEKYDLEFDVVYTHFLSNAFIAVGALSSYNKPIYAAVGEYNNIDIRKAYYSTSSYNSYISKISGFIAVSPQIKSKLLSLGVIDSKIRVYPNGIDSNLFFKRDKIEMRNKYGLPLDKKLIIFVGRFIHSKGFKKLLEASEKIDNIGLVLVGGGNEDMHSEKTVFKDKVSEEVVPELLSSADLFVLPTLHEGSCNAIIEAMACGLPIVSSDIPEIRCQCDSSFSILVDPKNVLAIRGAINEILSNKDKSRDMSRNALQSAKKFNIVDRAQGILEFIKP